MIFGIFLVVDTSLGTMVKEYDINSEVITEIEGHILDHPYFYGPDYLSLFNQESVMTFHLNTSNNDVSYLLNYLKGGDPTIDGQCF